ncbi:MAG: hypothetical protein HMLIMOIP_000973 [Candidatus Nitrosomirales archaeon]|jgi:hypothetical protein
MVKVEQIIINKQKMREIIEFMQEAVKEGLGKEEIMSQINIMLDKDAQKRIKQSEREIKQGKAKRFKSSKHAISWLHYQK